MKKLAVAMVVSMGLAGATGVYAATDGSLGTTSTGDFDINLNIPGTVGIWGLRDLPFTEDGQQTLNACVFSATNKVQFQVSSTNDNFKLAGGNINAADFTVTIKDKKNSVPSVWGEGGLGSGDIATVNYDVTGAAKPSPDDGTTITSICTGADQTIDITVDISNATTDEGVYTSNVELVVSAI